MSEPTEDAVEEEQVNPLEMSDEDIMNMPEPEPEQSTPIEEEPILEETETVLEEDDGEETEEEEAIDDGDTEEVSEEPEPVAETKDEVVPEEAADSVDEAEKGGDTPPEADYKAEYNKILAPFKANGREVSVSNADEAVRLMQMGADYGRKMQGLKPNLKLLKMLDNNGLLEESKLSYLIDLDKKDPEAIKKLLKDAKIDPLDVDLDTDTEYQPKAYTVSDKEVELDNVLEKIQDSDTYADTIDVISNKWDESSKRVLLDQPAIIEVINDHMSTGIYEQIQSVVAKKQMLGELTGLSNLEAYKQVGDEMQAAGSFANQQQAAAANTPPPPQANVADPKLKDRKRAASSTKSAPTKKAKQGYNPLSLSDEEFDKVAAPL